MRTNRRRGFGDIVPLYVQPGPDGNLPPALPNNVQGPVLAPQLQAFLQGFVGTQNNGAADADPTGLTAQAYPTPGAGDQANVYGANGPYVDDVWSNMMQQGLFSGTLPAAVIGRKNALPPAGGFFSRPVIIPDQYLPGPLKRESQLTNRRIFIPNQWDQQIQQEMKRWQWIAEHGGLKSCCRIPELGAPIYQDPPWVVMPSQGEEFQVVYNQQPSFFTFDGTNQVMGQFRCPVGYDGVLNKFVSQFTGDGLIEGSGDITWRVRIGERYARNLGSVTTTYQTFNNTFLGNGACIRIVSGQYVTVYISIPAGSPVSGGVIQAALFGWFYPRR